MLGTTNCTYETPCGWCTKWDKKCDKKIGESPTKPYDYLKEAPVNQTCKSEEDHEWECCGVSTAGTTYRCKKCYVHKDVPFTTKPLETYLTGTSVVEEIIDQVVKEN